jgi:hypothetical protein
MTLLCNIAAAAGHFYARGVANGDNILLFSDLMLFGGAVIGFVSLALLPVVMKVRRAPPPTGVIAFGICVAAAPILALLVRATG